LQYEDVDKIPDPPSSDVSLGVLPRLISKLVERRRTVKKLMAEKGATEEQKMQVNLFLASSY
jgi:DNA polymerase alpha subunit A